MICAYDMCYDVCAYIVPNHPYKYDSSFMDYKVHQDSHNHSQKKTVHQNIGVRI